MISTFRKCVFSIASVGIVAALAGCGGDGSSSNGGFAPDNVLGLTMQFIPGVPDAGDSPGMMNISDKGTTMSSIDVGVVFQSSINYIRTGPDTASVSVSLFDPKPPTTPTTTNYNVAFDVIFHEGGETGDVVSWDFVRTTGGTLNPRTGTGSSGRVVIVR